MNNVPANKLLVILGVAVLATSLGGCRTWPFHRNVTGVKVDVTSSALLNPDGAGRPYPVMMRVYQLKTKKAFIAASYEDLLDHDESVLAADLRDVTTETLQPGAGESLTVRMLPDVGYIGFAVFGRSTDKQAGWKLTVPREEIGSDPLKITLAGQDIAVDASLSGTP